ncbi:recombinase family protein [Variovorax sp. HW608]|uniref:recombinase family protein n=1 Tax=Variovorax sp. HW608 TaxID=1034889 RepID=UPI0012FD1481|nr:recombinase family protein [Variovorax sp. HW608]
MTTGLIAAVAEFERDLLVERTRSGLARRAKADGRTLERAASPDRGPCSRRAPAAHSGPSVARALKTSRATAIRARDGPRLISRRARPRPAAGGPLRFADATDLRPASSRE